MNQLRLNKIKWMIVRINVILNRQNEFDSNSEPLSLQTFNAKSKRKKKKNQTVKIKQNIKKVVLK